MTEQQYPENMLSLLDHFSSGHKLQLPATPARTVSRRRARVTPIARAITSLREDYGLTFEAIRTALSAKLGRKLALATLYTWSEGAEPRSISVESTERALDEIKSEHEIIVGGAWIEADRVQRQVQAWEALLSRRQIAVAADVSKPVIDSWAVGRHRVRRRKWETVVARVNSILEQLAKG